MVHLLVPAALFGLSLLAIPIIAHLFQPRRVRQTPFSSLRWLHLTQQRLARRIKWHQLLLFALRAAFVIVLVLALARPQWSGAGGSAPSERFIVIDVSRSMRYKTTEGKVTMHAARKVASELVSRAAAGDRTAVLLAGSSTSVLTDLDGDASALTTEIGQLEAGWTGTDLSSSLPVIEAMLAQKREGATVDIYVITDNHQAAWQTEAVQAFSSQLGEDASVHLIDVGPTSPGNIWIADARVVAAGDDGPATLIVDVSAMDGPHTRNISVTNAQVAGPNKKTVEIRAGQVTSAAFELSSREGIAHIELDPKDQLPHDDAMDVILSDTGAMRLLIVSDDVRRSAIHPVTAMRVLNRTRRRLNVTTKTSRELFPADIADADAIVLAGVTNLSSVNVEAIRTSVTAGGGLAVFAGPDTDPSVLNSSQLLPLTVGAPARPSSGPTAPLADVDWLSPLFEGLLDPTIGDVAIAQVSRFRRLTGTLPPEARVLATVDDGSPLIIDYKLGSGQVMLFATSAGDAWWDMPRRASYVALIERLVDILSGGSPVRVVESGQAVELTIASLKPDQTVAIVTPSGAVRQPSLRESGTRLRLRLPNVEDPGVYTLQRSGEPDEPAFVVRPARGDNVLSRTNTAALAQAWAPANLQVVSSEAELHTMLTARRRTSLWPLLIMLGGLLLLAEMYLVHRLCPRVQPVVATPIVRRQMHAPSAHHAEAV